MPTDEPADRDLTELAAFGPFFAVRRTTGSGSWHRLRELLDGPLLSERVTQVRITLTRMAGADVEPRVAASTLSLSLFARLLSPVLGASVAGIALPRTTLDATRWQQTERGPWPLALTGSDADPDPTGLIVDVISALVDRLSAAYGLSEQVLWGNVASAAFGAITVIGSIRPDLIAPARDAGAALLEGPLDGTGQLRGTFVRSSCCLYYRIPGGGYCGDCVLTAR